MLRKLLPIVFLILGTSAGIGAAIFTSPAEVAENAPAETDDQPLAENTTDDDTKSENVEFVRLNNQFVVPLVKGDKVDAMVVVSLSIETRAGMSEKIFAHEPKLRALFLRVLFDHANMGGFRGAFTQSDTMDLLRTALRETAQKEMGKDVFDVLIVDIARQDTQG